MDKKYEYDLTEDQLSRFLTETGKASDLSGVKSLEDILALDLMKTVTYFLKSPYYANDSFVIINKVLLELSRQLQLGDGFDAARLELYSDLYYIIHWNHDLMNPTNALIHNIANRNQDIYGTILLLERIENGYSYYNVELGIHILKTLMDLTTNFKNFIWFVSLSCVNRHNEPFTFLETCVKNGIIEKPELKSTMNPLYFVDELAYRDLDIGFIPKSKSGDKKQALINNFVIRLNELFDLRLQMRDKQEFIIIPLMDFIKKQGGFRKGRKSRKSRKTRNRSRKTRK